MTTDELIRHLKEMPEDTEVVFVSVEFDDDGEPKLTVSHDIIEVVKGKDGSVMLCEDSSYLDI